MSHVCPCPAFSDILIFRPQKGGATSEAYRVKSGKFGRTFANSVNTDETAPYEPSYQDFHCLLS